MAQERYRPSYTADQIAELIDCIEDSANKTPTLVAMQKAMKIFLVKIDIGLKEPAYLANGRKPGPASKMDIMKADIQEDYDKQRKEMPYGQAVIAAKMYTDLGQPVPQDIQTIIDLGDTANDSNN